jgi:hypothetical protein
LSRVNRILLLFLKKTTKFSVVGWNKEVSHSFIAMRECVFFI